MSKDFRYKLLENTLLHVEHLEKDLKDSLHVIEHLRHELEQENKNNIIKAIEKIDFIFYKLKYNNSLIYTKSIDDITIRIILDPESLDLHFELTKPFDLMAGGKISKHNDLRFKELSKVGVDWDYFFNCKIKALIIELEKKIIEFTKRVLR